MSTLLQLFEQAAGGNILAIFKCLLFVLIVVVCLASFRNAFAGKNMKWVLTMIQLIILVILFRIPESVYEDIYLSLVYGH